MPERKLVYKKLAHTADTGFEVEAPSLARLYIDCALALTDHLAPLDLIAETETKKLQITAENRESLMVKWLNEILFLFEKDRYLCHRITLENFDGLNISATLTGEFYKNTKHGAPSEIKAATYHQLKIDYVDNTDEPHFFARVFLDL